MLCAAAAAAAAASQLLRPRALGADPETLQAGYIAAWRVALLALARQIRVRERAAQATAAVATQHTRRGKSPHRQLLRSRARVV